MYKAAVIEDEPNVRKELVLFTPWAGCGIMCSGEAGSGTEGIELIKKTAPDIVLTDIRMPGQDGLQMIREVQQLCAAGTVALEPQWIIISGYTEFEYARTALQMGVQEYLLKPVEEDKLKESLVRCIDRIRKNEEHKKTETVPFFHEYTADSGDPAGYVARTVALIREKYVQGITIEEAAALLGISAGHLSRLFKKCTGYTFMDYLMYERVTAAARLLRENGSKVYEIADLVGYEDSRYFSQIFRRITGYTPLEFRNGQSRP